MLAEVVISTRPPLKSTGPSSGTMAKRPQNRLPVRFTYCFTSLHAYLTIPPHPRPSAAMKTTIPLSS